MTERLGKDGRKDCRKSVLKGAGFDMQRSPFLYYFPCTHSFEHLHNSFTVESCQYG